MENIRDGNKRDDDKQIAVITLAVSKRMRRAIAGYLKSS